MGTPDMEKRPAPVRHRRLVDYEEAEVITPMIYPPQPRLIVKGLKPHPGMTVSLVPLVYIRQPEYWGIEVVGELGDPEEPVAAQIPAGGTPYTAELDLTGVIGTCGIEVIGANKTEQMLVEGG